MICFIDWKPTVRGQYRLLSPGHGLIELLVNHGSSFLRKHQQHNFMIKHNYIINMAFGTNIEQK